MNQATSKQNDPDMLDEYDFSKGVRGKYVRLNLEPSHKAIRDYYATLQQYAQQGIKHEGAVSSPFDTLLHVCAKQINATFIPQHARRTASGSRIVIDGVVRHEHGFPFAYWEAKDIDDYLAKAIREKRDAGYPLDNTLFQTPPARHLVPKRRGSP